MFIHTLCLIPYLFIRKMVQLWRKMTWLLLVSVFIFVFIVVVVVVVVVIFVVRSFKLAEWLLRKGMIPLRTWDNTQKKKRERK